MDIWQKRTITVTALFKHRHEDVLGFLSGHSLAGWLLPHRVGYQLLQAGEFRLTTAFYGRADE